MQVPILNGIFTDSAPGVRASYPLNYIPTVTPNGISNGFLRPGDGLVANGSGPGTDRGGINWNGTMYRVMGSKLVSVGSDGSTTELGDVGGTNELVSFDYSFDRLAVSSNSNLFYYDGTTFSQVVSANLGDSLDNIWIDGFHMSTDGEFLVVSELNDPFAFSATKYGSSELDPDPVKALLKLRNEAIALNRHTIEHFDNIGGTGFPFQVINGAQIQRGTIGTHTCCIFMEQIAFIGGGRNEEVSIYIAINGRSNSIATKTINDILRSYTEAQLEAAKIESVNDRGSYLLYVHLPDQTLVYDGTASQQLGTPVWCKLSSGLGVLSQYRARNFVHCYGRWNVGDPQSSTIGYTDETIGSHWGSHVSWEISTQIFYNEGRGAIFSELELVALTGQVANDTTPKLIRESHSEDGLTWSNEVTISTGEVGERAKKLLWRKLGFMRLMRIQRFRGDSATHITFIRLEANLEALRS